MHSRGWSVHQSFLATSILLSACVRRSDQNILHLLPDLGLHLLCDAHQYPLMIHASGYPSPTLGRGLLAHSGSLLEPIFLQLDTALDYPPEHLEPEATSVALEPFFRLKNLLWHIS